MEKCIDTKMEEEKEDMLSMSIYNHIKKYIITYSDQDDRDNTVQTLKDELDSKM